MKIWENGKPNRPQCVRCSAVHNRNMHESLSEGYRYVCRFWWEIPRNETTKSALSHKLFPSASPVSSYITRSTPIFMQSSFTLRTFLHTETDKWHSKSKGKHGCSRYDWYYCIYCGYFILIGTTDIMCRSTVKNVCFCCQFLCLLLSRNFLILISIMGRFSSQHCCRIFITTN